MVYKNDQIPDNIVRAANTLIFTRGIKGWNMDDCAGEAGITKRTLYQYIESKEKLIEFILLNFITETQKTITAELSSCKDFYTGFKKIQELFPSLIIKMDALILRSIFLTYPNIEKKASDAKKDLTAGLISFLEQGKNDGYIRKELNAETILEILQALVLYYIKNDPENLKHKITDSFNAVVCGFLIKEGAE
mgnify:FL=1